MSTKPPLNKLIDTLYKDDHSELTFKEINDALRYDHPDFVVWLFKKGFRNVNEFDNTFTDNGTITFNNLDKAATKYCKLVNDNMDMYKQDKFNVPDITPETDIEKRERENHVSELYQNKYFYNFIIYRTFGILILIIISIVVFFIYAL